MALSVKDLTLGGQYSTGGRFLGTLLHLAMSYREATATFELDGQCTEQRYALSTLFTHVPPADRVDPFEPGAPARLEYTERGSGHTERGSGHTERGSSDIVTFAIYPSARAARTPLDLCLALDNSGSMATGVTAAGRENLGHTSLDMVKHGARTLISGLLPDARLGVVSFSTEAKQVFYLAPMTPSNQAAACAAVNGIVTENCTNIFGGLALCLAMLPAPSAGRQQAVVLLTDGVNNEGPADVLAALKAWEKAQGRRAPPIYTMGFGNATESPRLVALSAHTDAQFGYMCDAGMVGTTFVNAMANLLTLQGADATITVESLAARSVAPPPKTILVGRFLVDQPKWVTVSVPSGPYRYVLRYTHIGRPGVTEVVGVSAAAADPVALSVERFRQDILATLEEAQGKAQYDRPGALALIQGLAQRLGECPYKREARHQGFFSDVVGQITEAIERKYGTWEGHYLQTLHQAYRNQVCTNFKDAGLQGFTSPYRTGIIEALDTVFNGLPPQPPTGEVPRSAAPLQSMAAYNNSDDPCFAGWSLVRLLDGSVKRVDAIVKGDRMANGGTILAVVRTYTGGTAALVRLRRRGDTNVGLWITPYHPVGDKSPPGGVKTPPAPPFVGVKSPMGVETRSQKRRRLSSIPTANPLGGGGRGGFNPHGAGGVLPPQWCFPCDLGAVREQACPELYSFVMDRGHTMQIGGFECITLGHGCQADKARHPYLGTGRVIGDLAAQPGYATGLVKLLSGAFTRNPVTGLLDGLNPERVLPEDLPVLIPCSAFELRAGLRV
jgi:hypothetical protein